MGALDLILLDQAKPGLSKVLLCKTLVRRFCGGPPLAGRDGRRPLSPGGFLKWTGTLSTTHCGSPPSFPLGLGLGILAAYYIAKLPRLVKGVLDVVLTLPLVLPPTVVGWLLLVLLGPNRPIGAWVQAHFGLRLVMTWWSAVFATVVVAFPLMYRTARGAFESFDPTLAEAAATLGRSNIWIFWRVRMPVCRQGILAGTVLAFARALGEYGATSMIAGYTPGRTATISTTVYQLWRTDNDTEALRWVLVNIAISAVFLLAVNLLEARQKRAGKGGRR